MAYILKTSGERIEVEPKNGKNFTLKEMQEIVGGYIEIITLSSVHIMVINEEGKLIPLPYNEQATSMYRHDAIAGDALVCLSIEVE